VKFPKFSRKTQDFKETSKKTEEISKEITFSSITSDLFEDFLFFFKIYM